MDLYHISKQEKDCKQKKTLYLLWWIFPTVLIRNKSIDEYSVHINYKVWFLLILVEYKLNKICYLDVFQSSKVYIEIKKEKNKTDREIILNNKRVVSSAAIYKMLYN